MSYSCNFFVITRFIWTYICVFLFVFLVWNSKGRWKVFLKYWTLGGRCAIDSLWIWQLCKLKVDSPACYSPVRQQPLPPDLSLHRRLSTYCNLVIVKQRTFSTKARTISSVSGDIRQISWIIISLTSNHNWWVQSTELSSRNRCVVSLDDAF